MNVLLWLLISFNAAMIVWGLLDGRRTYRFTLMAAVMFLGFAVPQCIGLSNEAGYKISQYLPEGSLDLVYFMSFLCLAAYWLGDHRGVTHPGTSPIHPFKEYDPSRMVWVAAGLLSIGVLITQIGYNLLDRDYINSLGTQWTGPITILMFFQSMQKYGFAIAVLLYFRSRSPVALMCVLFSVFTSFLTFIYSARRGAAADTFFIVVLGMYFGRGIRIPAWLLGIAFVMGTLWSNSIGMFRAHLETSFLEKLEKSDMLGNMDHILTHGGFEMANAAVECWCANESGDFDYGQVHWNQFIHAYFPGQIFGHELKKAIKFPERHLALEMLNYQPPPGTTLTGMSDAFTSFWYLGCLKFYVIGYVMGRWFNRALRGDLRSQLAYMALMSSALHTISHGTFWLFNQYLHMVIFAYPALYWARHGFGSSATNGLGLIRQTVQPATT